jgi:hypothetical protein
MWCVPAIDNEYVDRMEDVLRLYARPIDPAQPVICLDERPVQLHDSAREGAPMQPGTCARRDYEYVRRGTANVFCIIEPKAGRRLTHATKNRTGAAFARALRRVERRYRDAKRIHLVLDNLSTHSKKSVLDAFGPTKGAALWRRFKIHYTPKHASWLNAAEMEAGLVSRECLGKRRIGTLGLLQSEVRAWSRRADGARRKIQWKFTVNDARRVFRYDGIATRRAEH